MLKLRLVLDIPRADPRWNSSPPSRKQSRRAKIDAEIAAVFCDRERGESANTDVFLDCASVRHLACHLLLSLLPPRAGAAAGAQGTPLPDWRASYDQEVIARLEPYGFDLAMLAGYMLVASDALCQRFDLLNLHPAAPGGPKGIWQDVIWELIGQGAS